MCVIRYRSLLFVLAMSGIAYFFKPKINSTESANAGGTSSTEKKKPEMRAGRRSRSAKSSETTTPEEPSSVDQSAPRMDADNIVLPPVQETKKDEHRPSVDSDNPPTPTPKIKLKFNLRSQSVQNTSDDVETIVPSQNETNDSSSESSDNETRLKIADNDINAEELDAGPIVKDEEPPPPPPLPPPTASPTKKKHQSPSSRKKVLSRLIGPSANTLSLDEPSPVKIPPGESTDARTPPSQFSEVKQTKSGRTIKYTPYFKELVQGVSVSPPSSPSSASMQPKRPSTQSKKKSQQTPIKADLDAIKNGSLTPVLSVKSKKTKGSPKTKKQTSSPVKRIGQGKKTPATKGSSNVKSKRSSTAMVIDEGVESEDEDETPQVQSDDEEFRNEGHSSEDDDEEEYGLDVDEDLSSAPPSDEEEWTVGNKIETDRTSIIASTLPSIPNEMLDGYSLWAIKYRARHRTMIFDDKRLYRTWKKMSAHDRQRWCLKAEKENYHYPITAELLKTTIEPTTTTKIPPAKVTKRKKPVDEIPHPALLQKTLNQYSKQQSSISSIRPPNAFVKQQQPTVPVVASSKHYDIVDIAAGIYLLGESLTKMGEKVRQLGHLNPRGASASASIDNLSAILFDGTLCACNLMACLGNEITSTNPLTTKPDPLTSKLMDNVGIILPGLN